MYLLYNVKQQYLYTDMFGYSYTYFNDASDCLLLQYT